MYPFEGMIFDQIGVQKLYFPLIILSEKCFTTHISSEILYIPQSLVKFFKHSGTHCFLVVLQVYHEGFVVVSCTSCQEGPGIDTKYTKIPSCYFSLHSVSSAPYIPAGSLVCAVTPHGRLHGGGNRLHYDPRGPGGAKMSKDDHTFFLFVKTFRKLCLSDPWSSLRPLGQGDTEAATGGQALDWWVI